MSIGEWATLRLGDVLRPNTDVIDIDPFGRYQQVTIRLWGRGVVPRGEINGADIKGTARTRVRSGQFIVSKIDARNGAMGIVPPELDGALASNDFPAFDVDADRLRPSFLSWLSRTAAFVDLCKRASEGTTNRVRLSQERMLGLGVSVPSPAEQDGIVATLDAAAARVAEAQQLCREIDEEAHALLRSAFHRIADGAPRHLMSQIAPLHRRQVAVSVLETYPQVSVRSFGKGTFHREAVSGAEITWEQPYLVHAGDVLLSNIKAWEGAVAVAGPEDHGRFGSHRYLTCVPKPGVATAGWIAFFLLTGEGLEHLGKASPGSTDRNRTLGTKALMGIPVPLPPVENQKWFDRLQQSLKAARAETARIVAEAEAMLPAILDRAFKGKLAGMGAAAQSGRVVVAVNPSAASIKGATIATKGSTVIVEGSTGAVMGSTKAVRPSFVPVEGSMTTAEGSNTSIEGPQVTAEGASVGARAARTAESASSGGSIAVQTWNVPEIAAIQAELVRRNGGSPTLGRKKISKGAYLAAALLGAKQNPPPLRKVAGPFNTQGQNEIEAYAAQAGWFRDSGLALGQKSVSRYRAGDRIAEAAAKTKELVAARAAEFERFMRVYSTWDSETAELHATAHAAWNGLLTASKPATEAAIIETFYEWSNEKSKFKVTQIRAALTTLRSLDLEPNGRGPVVAGIGEDDLWRLSRP